MTDSNEQDTREAIDFPLMRQMADGAQDARQKYEELFLSGRIYQSPEYWVQELGELVKKVRTMAQDLTTGEQSVMDFVAAVGVMAVLGDFIHSQFQEEAINRARNQQ